MKLIEPINDDTLCGIGFFSIDTDFAVRSFLAIFWQKENREIWLDFLYINFKIKIS